ncbi:MAG: hypothetical protein CVU63_17175 [Deltaproteobacteria bacterium HGW-Deltaproteobacteria-20]|nr:MAG: hypothetical protein CVU63_17175 [Deltaproteobacteria bacterium HGW-Deltaproteobacteria-20]
MRWYQNVPCVVLLSLVGAFACESEDPEASQGNVGGASQGRICDPLPDSNLELFEDLACVPLATDYTPRDAGSENDAYPACVSDEGQYVISRASGADGISALGRVGAFEEIGVLLGFGAQKVPTPEDFVAARVIYSQDQGLESRVNRREDEHYPPLGEACQDLSLEEQLANADRCVGAAKIRPLLLDAFQQGAQGKGDATVHVATIESALLWFLYVSMHKEVTSATTAKDDIDSVWAKYTGGEQRDGKPIGFARYVRARSRQVHDRIFDGVLAVRCWRDLDSGDTAVNLAMRDRAQAQLDRALLKGLALIVRSRVKATHCPAAFESARILGEVLDREATVRDAAMAQTLREELAKGREGADADAVIASLDALFDCP